jgi:acylphosphatase
MTARRLVIKGRVHGVGFRDWLVAQAEAMGVAGWVRNRRDGSVEAVFDGDPAAVEELLRACRRGPRQAAVAEIVEEFHEVPVEPGFRRLPTA